jgi:hypothetical protein
MRFGTTTGPFHLEGTQIINRVKRSDMTNESEEDPQQQGKQDPTGKVNPSPENPGQGRRTQDISEKNPPQGSDPQPQGQEKPEDEKRWAS